MNKITEWKLEDRYPELPIESISLLNDQVESLIFRKRKEDNIFLSDKAIEIMGLINICNGLEYHFNNFIDFSEKYIKVFSSKDLKDSCGERHYIQLKLYHEIVAYVNRLGQFYYFSSSKLVKERIPNVHDIIPKIVSLKIFRQKYAAHRSLDYPKGESYINQLEQALSLNGNSLIISNYTNIVFAIRNGSDPLTRFTPKVDHHIIKFEIINLFQQLLK